MGGRWVPVLVVACFMIASQPVESAAKTQTIGAVGTFAGDYFGSSIAEDNGWLVVGAPGVDKGADFNFGAAFTFQFNSAGNWGQREKLEASDGQPSDNFGSSVGIAGDLMAIGAPDEDGALTCIGSGAGAVYVFTRSGISWNEVQKIIAPDTHCGAIYGYSIAMEATTLIVGAKQHSAGGVSQGKVFVYEWNGSSYDLQQELTASNAHDYDDFGSSVALDGDTLVVGASSDLAHPAGYAYVFARTGPGAAWTEQQILQGQDNNDGDLFGSNVDIDGDTLIVGAQADNTNGYWSGAAHVFERSGPGATWTQVAKLFPSDGDSGDGNLFGWDVALDGDNILVGAPRDERGGGAYGSAGSAYLFTRDAGGWDDGERLWRNDQATLQFFGDRVHLHENQAFVGAFGQNNGRGVIHRYDLNCPSALAPIPAGCQVVDFVTGLPL